MIALLQRVTRAWVEVESRRIAEIDAGLLVFLGVERGDTEVQAERLLARVLGYRVFEDRGGRMNFSLSDSGGALLLVPQFTLAADTGTGRRPSFTTAAVPAEGQRLFDYFYQQAQARLGAVEVGRFGASMQVGLVNSGPATFWLQVSPDDTRATTPG